ncbi:uncharacterized protein FIESC28_00984 [Fusarium coffeatum]|uniref:RNA helicase n=1 Tax=Fusarium coffeatum TaxID=231269 RepID=A0A366SA57_9HYPO|nr:uncharacterized protein FIESC28_00984 [Fusarium coffeatum]RBR26201.1 hypothetical protein FIESC28_00984 [Fusarium coffeatum]
MGAEPGKQAESYRHKQPIRAGHILVFVTKEREIEEMFVRLRKQHPTQQVIAMYASLPKADRDAVTLGFNKPTIIVSTNICETSVTIPSVEYVDECELKLESAVDPRLSMTSLLPVAILKDSARQRAGRAGRTADGEVYRMYNKETHDRYMLDHAPRNYAVTDCFKIPWLLVFVYCIRHSSGHFTSVHFGECLILAPALYSVANITKRAMTGDILVFMSAMGDTNVLCVILKEKHGEKLLVVPLHAPQTPAEQKKATSRSQPDGSVRKYVVATDVAEASPTIPGIVYDIDTGIEKRPGYNPRIDMDSLTTYHITQASAMRSHSARGYISLQGAITETGRMAAKLPIHPMWWNAIAEGARLGCTSDIIMLAAVGSVQGMDQWCLNAFLDGNIIEEILRARSQVIKVYNKMPQSNAHAATFDAEYETKVAKALARDLYHNIVIRKDGHV